MLLFAKPFDVLAGASLDYKPLNAFSASRGRTEYDQV